MFTIGVSRAISHSDDTEQQAQQVTGNPRIRGERRGGRQQEAVRKAQRTPLSTAKAKSSTQRPQTCTEAATKYYNCTANGAGEEREHRPPTLQKTMARSGNAYSLQ